MQSENLTQKINGLAFHDLSDKTRNTLTTQGYYLAKDLLYMSDKDLSTIGITKKQITVIDRCLKILGLKRGLKKNESITSSVATLRTLNRNSNIPHGCGTYSGMRMENIIGSKLFRYLRHVYYTVSWIDYTDDIKDEIGLKYIIEKPGTNPDLEKLLNDEYDNNIRGIQKLKLKMHLSKEMRTENKNRAISAERLPSKSLLQSVNHGHTAITTEKEKDIQYDYRPFAEWIKEQGYDIPTKKAHKTEDVELSNLYKIIKNGTKPTLLPEGDIYIANITFLELISNTIPEKLEEAQEMCFTDFKAKEYYTLLNALELSPDNIKNILNKRQWILPDCFITDPYTGKEIYISGISIKNNLNVTGFPRMTFFNENTWEEYQPEDFFRKTAD